MKTNNLGFTFVEIIIALGLSAILIPALGQALSFSIRVASQGEKFSQAYNLAQQGMENMFAQKSKNWNAFSNSTTTLVISPFTRVITVEDGLRCGIGESICDTGGVNNPDTKKVTVVVSWPESGGMQTASVSAYVTNH